MTRSDVRMLPAGGSPGNQLVRLRQVKEVPGILSWGLGPRDWLFSWEAGHPPLGLLGAVAICVLRMFLYIIHTDVYIRGVIVIVSAIS